MPGAYLPTRVVQNLKTKTIEIQHGLKNMAFHLRVFFSFRLTTCRFEKKRRWLKNERKVVENREKKVGKNMALVHKHTSVRFSFLNTPLYLPGVAIFVEIFLVLFSQLVCFFLQYFWLLGDAGMKKRLGMIQKV